MVIAACGSSSSSPSRRGKCRRWRLDRSARQARRAPARPRRRRGRRWHDPGRLPEARWLARPGRDAGPRRLRHHGAVVRVPVHPRPERRRTSPRDWPSSGRRTRTARVWTFDLRQNVKWHDGTPFTSADVVATMERLVAAGNSGLKGVLGPGGAVATDPNTVIFTLVGANGNFPYLVSVFNAQTLITPTGLRRRHDAERQARRAPAPGSSRQLRHADGRDVRPQRRTGGAARRRSTAPSSSSSTTPARWSPPTRATRSMPSSSSTSCPARRCSTTRTSPSSTPRRRSIARSGCARTRASSPTSGSARRSP